MYFDQTEYEIRCEWGLEGINTLAPSSQAVVIIDVFSFTTCVDAALSRGAYVFPYLGPKDKAAEYARSKEAVLAMFGQTDPNGYSLRPSSLLRLPPGTSVVLPSPNGSTLSLSTGSVYPLLPVVYEMRVRWQLRHKQLARQSASSPPENDGQMAVYGPV